MQNPQFNLEMHKRGKINLTLERVDSGATEGLCVFLMRNGKHATIYPVKNFQWMAQECWNSGQETFVAEVSMLFQTKVFGCPKVSNEPSDFGCQHGAWCVCCCSYTGKEGQYRKIPVFVFSKFC